jgi:hypothetical protein
MLPEFLLSGRVPFSKAEMSAMFGSSARHRSSPSMGLSGLISLKAGPQRMCQVRARRRNPATAPAGIRNAWCRNDANGRPR